MYILERDNTGTHTIPMESKLLAERKIFLTGSIHSGMATDMVQMITWLQSRDSGAPINLYINSTGGEVYAGLLIYDVVKAAKVPIDLYCTGMAASMAAIILAGGSRGHRFILPHSVVMIHEPLNVGGGGAASASAMQRQAEEIIQLRDLSAELLAKDCGKSRKEVLKAISFDHFMNAEEAVKFGICDQIVPGI